MALPDTVWSADMCSPLSTIEQPSDAKGTTDIQLLAVIDLGTREIILATPFQVSNHGNVKSSLVCKKFEKLFLKRKGDAASFNLIVHTDRGSKFASKQFVALLFGEKVHLSMSRPNTPIDNAVAKRYTRFIKSQLLVASEWPLTF